MYFTHKLLKRMKFWKHTFIALSVFLGAATTVVYTSCEKDGCLELKCENGGACTDGFCRCPSEYEGATCAEKIVKKFVGTYYGETRCVEDTTEFPRVIDTVDVFLTDSVTLALVQHSHITDTFYGTAGRKDTDLGVTISDMTITDKYVGGSLFKVTAKLDEGKTRLTVYMQETDTASTIKTDCNFLGFK